MLSNALSQTMHQSDLEGDLLDLLVEYDLTEKLIEECSVSFPPSHVLQGLFHNASVLSSHEQTPLSHSTDS